MIKLLVVHNAYLHRGGEDVCVDNEWNALREAGLDVTLHSVLSSRGADGVQTALGAPFGRMEEGRLEKMLESLRPDILHAHNLYPLLSPRLFRIAHRGGIKTVLTLHNFRPLCMNGLFMTPKGDVCERCAPGPRWHGVWRRCYRSSLWQSLGMATHLALASSRHWYDDVDLFIAPSQFLKDKYVSYGFPVAKIKVQGHFLPDWPTEPAKPPEGGILYLGRLAEEKGLPWLAGLFMDPASQGQLNIAGEGPLRAWVEGLRHPRIRYLGLLGPEAKAKALQASRALVLASRCYENFPLVIAEANSYGVPVIVANRGGMAECVAPGINGEHFEAENRDSFRAALRRIDKTYSGIAARETLRSWAHRRFSLETFLATRLALYRELTPESRMSPRLP